MNEMSEAPWRRLTKIRLVVPPLIFVPILVVTAGIFLVAGARPGDGAFLAMLITVASGLVVAGAISGYDWLDWRAARYRVTDTHVELRSGVVFRRHRSIPRDRVRSVDVTANPLYRIFGLAVVRVGTGENVGSAESELKLDGVTQEHADELRRALLRRGAARPGDGARAGEGAEDESAGVEIARMRRSWLRFAPLTLSVVLVIAGGSLGIVGDVFGGAGGALASVPRKAVEVVGSVWLLVVVVAAAALLVGFLGSFLLFVEAWSNFRLLREPDGTLRVRRGLLTTRSVSLEESRLRGAELAKPLLVRWAGGARVNVVATGLSSKDEGNKAADRKALLPPAPRTEAYRVAAEVIGESIPANTSLVRHPRAALRRRAVWALAPVVAAVIALAVLGHLFAWMPGWAWPVALIGLPVAAGFALDAYRCLGHAMTPRYLVTRSGTGIRRTVAVRRDGIIGWKVSQSWFQQRAGVASVAATTAAGTGAYKIRDAGTSEVLAFAEAAAPGLLEPFLEPAERPKVGV